MNTAVRQSTRRTRRRAPACVAAFIALAAMAFAPAAVARNVYVANSAADSVSVFDGTGYQPLGPAIDLPGTRPVALAITPDGKRLYTTNDLPGTVSVIDTASNQVVAGPIKVGTFPEGIAIAPDGSRVLVTNQGSDTVFVIDTTSNQVIGEPIAVGDEPQEVAITPDGTRAYVTNFNSASVTVIDAKTNQVVGAPIKVGTGPEGIAIAPDGRRAYVANHGSANVSIIDTASNQVVGEPAVGVGPVNVAITPDGGRAFVSTSGTAAVSVIDLSTGLNLPEIEGVSLVGNVALSPDGKTAYLTSGLPAFYAVSTQTNQLLAGPIKTLAGPAHIAVIPDQPPVASFSTLRARPGVPVGFDAAASKDPDGVVTAYAWAFGDRQNVSRSTALTSHAYAKPGSYRTTLTLTDNEGCSTLRLFTGQTAYCNGSAVATTTRVVEVAYPGVRVKCPRRAGARACAFKLQVVAKKPEEGGKAKAQSAVAKAKVKPGRSAIVSLRAKKAFRARLARAKSVVVKETATVAGSQSVRFRRLKVVR